MKFVYKNGDVKPVQDKPEKEVTINITNLTEDNKLKIDVKGMPARILHAMITALCRIFEEFIKKEDVDEALDSMCEAIKNQVKDNIKNESDF